MNKKRKGRGGWGRRESQISCFLKNKNKPFRANLSFEKLFSDLMRLEGIKPTPHPPFPRRSVPLGRGQPGSAAPHTPPEKFSPGSPEKLCRFSPPPPSQPNSELEPRLGLGRGRCLLLRGQDSGHQHLLLLLLLLEGRKVGLSVSCHRNHRVSVSHHHQKKNQNTTNQKNPDNNEDGSAHPDKLSPRCKQISEV